MRSKNQYVAGNSVQGVVTRLLNYYMIYPMGPLNRPFSESSE